MDSRVVMRVTAMFVECHRIRPHSDKYSIVHRRYIFLLAAFMEYLCFSLKQYNPSIWKSDIVPGSNLYNYHLLLIDLIPPYSNGTLPSNGSSYALEQALFVTLWCQCDAVVFDHPFSMALIPGEVSRRLSNTRSFEY